MQPRNFAHIHFPATKKSALNLKRLGEYPKNIYFTGCPSIDLIKSSKILELIKNLLINTRQRV